MSRIEWIMVGHYSNGEYSVDVRRKNGTRFYGRSHSVNGISGISHASAERLTNVFRYYRDRVSLTFGRFMYSILYMD